MPTGNPRGDSAELAAPPTPPAAGIAASLGLLRRPTTPFADEDVYNRFDLLLLPFLSHEPDYRQRAARFRKGLELAVQRLPTQEQRIVAGSTLLHKVPQNVNERKVWALRQLQEHHLVRPDASIKRVETIEEEALFSLAQDLRSREFAEEFIKRHGLASAASLRSEYLSGIGYTYRSFSRSLYIDPDDIRVYTFQTSILLRATRYDQRVLGQRYQWSGGAPDLESGDNPKVTVLSEDPRHSYLGTRPDPKAGSSVEWRMHFFHFGRDLDLGEDVHLKWEERHVDEARTARPYSFYIAHFADMEYIELSVRIPDRFELDEISAFVVADPWIDATVLARLPVRRDADGYFRHRFPDVTRGLQYGLDWVDLYTRPEA